MKLPKITNKQAEILELLYRYRFLNRIQIQSLMHHKDYKTINVWLRDLREKQFVEWIYSDHFLEKTKPAIYYLGSNSIRYLKTVTWDNEDGESLPYYPTEELHKRYKESKRHQSFIDRSILIADCCLALKTASSDTSLVAYKTITEADYLDPDRSYHFLAEHETLRPNLYIIKRRSKNSKTVIARYLLEIFDPHLPQYRLSYRIKSYVKLLTDYEWEGGEPNPTILLVLPNVYNLIYAKRKVRRLLLNEYYEPEDIPKHLHIRFTTTEQLQQHGIAAYIWEEGRKRFSV